MTQRDDRLLEFATERQAQYLEAIWQQGSIRAAARQLGVKFNAVHKGYQAVLRKAGSPAEVVPVEASAQTYVITSAVNATKAHAGFLRTLQLYCSLRGARLIVIPMRYKNPTRRDEVGDDDWWDALKIKDWPNLQVRNTRVKQRQTP